ncbi:MAG: hypothetical protein KA250_04895 [Verrucomicrobiales bacterium]|nr:hypothetical protein [Verrucomicrobiales bacterium]
MSSIFGVSALWAADGSDALDLDYSITSGESGELVWKIKDPTGGNREFSQEETQKLLREVHFPKALINAEAGKAPEVWTIGFFYLDGVATEKNLVTAEAAFRKGLQYDRPDGLLYLASAYHELGLAEKENDEKREKFFWKEGDLHLEVLAAGFESPAAFVIPLAGAYLFGWYDVKKDLSRAETLLNATEKVLPESPLVQLHKAKLRIYQKRYPEAYDYAEKAEKGFLEVRGDHEVIQEEFQKARAAKISAAVLGGQISKVDPEEFMEISKDSLGLNGPMAWRFLCYFSSCSLSYYGVHDGRGKMEMGRDLVYGSACFGFPPPSSRRELDLRFVSRDSTTVSDTGSVRSLCPFFLYSRSLAVDGDGISDPYRSLRGRRPFSKVSPSSQGLSLPCNLSRWDTRGFTSGSRDGLSISSS